MAQYAEVGGLLVEPEVSRWQLRSVRALGVALASCALVLLGFAAGQGAGLPHSQHDGLLQRYEIQDDIEAMSNQLQQDLEDALTKCALVVNQSDSAACRKDATMHWVKFVNLGVFKRGDPDRKRVKEACDAIERLIPEDEKHKFFSTTSDKPKQELCPLPGPTLRVRAELATELHMFGGDSFKDVHEKFPLDASWDNISAKMETLEMEGSVVYCLQEDDWVEVDKDSFRPMLDYECEPILLADYDSGLSSVSPSELRETVFEKDWKMRCPGDGAVCLF